ncbi:hypothetical protein VUR80DRAFT_7618 [Thermomyces stellatus]
MDPVPTVKRELPTHISFDPDGSTREPKLRDLSTRTPPRLPRFPGWAEKLVRWGVPWHVEGGSRTHPVAPLSPRSSQQHPPPLRGPEHLVKPPGLEIKKDYASLEQ